jgi:acyl-lipid omega-6 desaturase (Delta-12 desaturase)
MTGLLGASGRITTRKLSNQDGAYVSEAAIHIPHIDVRPKDRAKWRHVVEKYKKPRTGAALWQIANTFGPYLGLWAVMYYTVQRSWLLTALLAVVQGLFLVRLFIIFHDCGHDSFFRTHRANALVGFVAGIVTFTPYYHWRWEHAIHHSTAGHLDKRGRGDIWTMTVQEYLEASRWRRFAYQLARNPIVLFLLAPLFVFLVQQRYPDPGADNRERHSVWWTNLGILLFAIAMCAIFGVLDYVLIQLIATAVASGVGVWLFYVQHQFEDAYWERGANWDYAAAALEGSSFYKLPKILQWFSGNIGFHHIHHLSARIPNYNLQACHNADPLFQKVKPLTLTSSLKSITLRLWDEQTRKLVGYKHVRSVRKERRKGPRSRPSTK